MPELREELELIDKLDSTDFDKTFRKKIKKPKPELDHELDSLLETIEGLETVYDLSDQV